MVGAAHVPLTASMSWYRSSSIIRCGTKSSIIRALFSAGVASEGRGCHGVFFRVVAPVGRDGGNHAEHRCCDDSQPAMLLLFLVPLGCCFFFFASLSLSCERLRERTFGIAIG